ncbi:DUF6348 family protein [Stenotrophomonas sp. TWI169]|jgi:hypothetical protein|uniref:Uncharacterized protein n=1 Tax=Stenotrophomonas maltophilia TaxID=40324 RepID=A0AAP7KZI5_STEMA|nr:MULTISPECIES: DUF6348 family protein [Stenotrophomonas]MBH1665510.1 hypothetical protein [Stenotrophomonas maltophilia]MDI9250134.1 DUF6348 family protein [Stenotrophomonas sp. RS-48]MDZ5842525.1 DUF6348 family protein [Stenotrophomonas maltophilia]OBU59881.1 hypothetical protein A9K56_16615 [Stenotrophomonas maltophilia]RXK63435.1 hypothetical protein ERT44_18590 [Stenotrophomonas sp. MA5]
MTTTSTALLPLLQQVLQDAGIASRVDGGALVLDSGLRLTPHAMAAHARDNGGWQTSTVIEAQHPTLFADGLFEYQHANGADEQASLLSGFQAWVRVDLATLQTAVGADDAQGLPMMGLTYPAGDDGKEHGRTVVLGPLAHYRAQEVEVATCSEDDHGSCPCCLFTRSMDAFDELLKARQFLAIRLFASRDADGLCEADCRVNGHDFAPALPLLRAYAASWPQAGLEFRKQYVVIRTGSPG